MIIGKIEEPNKIDSIEVQKRINEIKHPGNLFKRNEKIKILANQMLTKKNYYDDK